MDTDETDSSPAPKRRIIDMGQKVMSFIIFHETKFSRKFFLSCQYLMISCQTYFILSQVLLEEEGEEVQEVQNKLERERRTRMALEERVRLLEGQLYQVQS